jgi:hypothetical protein
MPAHRWRLGLEVFVLVLGLLALVAFRDMPSEAQTDPTPVTSLSSGAGLPGPLMIQSTETGGFDLWSPLRLLVGLVVAAVLVARIVYAVLGAFEAWERRGNQAQRNVGAVRRGPARQVANTV